MENKVKINELLFGIEVEVEFKPDNYLDVRSEYWDSCSDGSLRGASREYKSRRGFCFDKTILNVRNLYKLLKNVVEISPSQRCGLHVHISEIDNGMNFLKKSNGEWGLTRTYYQALLMEKYICEKLKEMTKSKQQHVRAWAKECLWRMEKKNGTCWCKSVRDRYTELMNDRYHAINACSLTRHGTLEVRLFASTMNSENVERAVALTRDAYIYGAKILKNKNEKFFNLLHERAKRRTTIIDNETLRIFLRDANKEMNEFSTIDFLCRCPHYNSFREKFLNLWTFMENAEKYYERVKRADGEDLEPEMFYYRALNL